MPKILNGTQNVLDILNAGGLFDQLWNYIGKDSNKTIPAGTITDIINELIVKNELGNLVALKARNDEEGNNISENFSKLNSLISIESYDKINGIQMPGIYKIVGRHNHSVVNDGEFLIHLRELNNPSNNSYSQYYFYDDGKIQFRRSTGNSGDWLPWRCLGIMHCPSDKIDGIQESGIYQISHSDSSNDYSLLIHLQTTNSSPYIALQYCFNKEGKLEYRGYDNNSTTKWTDWVGMSYNDLSDKPELSKVATSGKYDDLIGVPLLGIGNGEASNSLVQGNTTSNWEADTYINDSVVEYIENETVNENGLKIQLDDSGKIKAGAFGVGSSAFGTKAQALGGKSFAEGSKTIAFSNNTHAEGNGTFAAGQHAHSEGNGTSALGNASHAEGQETDAIGLGSHSEGLWSKAEGQGSHAEGEMTEAILNNSHAEGHLTKAKGNNSHAEGNDTEAKGENSHAEGYLTKAFGNMSHAEGNDTEASGNSSHSEGYLTKATEKGSHAEGTSAQATNEDAHAEGNNTLASGYRSHAEGFETVAKNTNSHAEGVSTITGGDHQHVQGKFNKEMDGNYAHVVGNGKSEDEYDENGNLIEQNRSNAHTLDWDGNAWFAGDVRVGENNKKLLTGDDVSTVAITGKYEDLSDKPIIPELPQLALVATSGKYNDLIDKPITILEYYPSQDMIDAMIYGVYVYHSQNHTTPSIMVVAGMNYDKIIDNLGIKKYFCRQYIIDSYSGFQARERIVCEDPSYETGWENIPISDDLATKEYISKAITKALNNDPDFANTILTELERKANTSDLSTVATSGSYKDLMDKPIILDSTSIDNLTTPGLYFNKSEIPYHTWFVVVLQSRMYVTIDGYIWDKDTISQFVYQDGKLIKREKVFLTPKETSDDPISYGWEKVPLNDDLATKDYVDTSIGDIETALNEIITDYQLETTTTTVINEDSTHSEKPTALAVKNYVDAAIGDALEGSY